MSPRGFVFTLGTITTELFEYIGPNVNFSNLVCSFYIIFKSIFFLNQQFSFTVCLLIFRCFVFPVIIPVRIYLV